MNVSHEMDSNLNISPKMSYGVLECDIVILQDTCLRFCNKRFGIDFELVNRGVICARPCISKLYFSSNEIKV